MSKKEIRKSINRIRLEEEEERQPSKKIVGKHDMRVIKELKEHIIARGEEVNEERSSTAAIKASATSSKAKSRPQTKKDSTDTISQTNRRGFRVPKSSITPYYTAASEVVESGQPSAPKELYEDSGNEDSARNQQPSSAEESLLPERTRPFPPEIGSDKERWDRYLELINKLPKKVGEDETFKRKELKKLYEP